MTERTRSDVLPALPTPAQLRAERDPSKRLLALVEPASRLLVRATALNEANDIRSQAAAIERYARSIRLSTEAIGAAQTIARRAEMRIGELDQKRRPSNQHAKRSSSTNDDLPRQQRHEFRQMAEHQATVEEVLGELAPNGKASRHAVLRAVKSEQMHDGNRRRKEADERASPNQLLQLRPALRQVIAELRREQALGLTFNAAALVRDIKTLCRELEELLP
jgi:hypothetical protein